MIRASCPFLKGFGMSEILDHKGFTMAVFNRIKEIRKKQNIRQIDLANAIGCDRKTIYSYEKGTRCPSLEIAILMVEALHTTMDQMFYVVRDGRPHPSTPDDQAEGSNEIIIEVINKQRRSAL